MNFEWVHITLSFICKRSCFKQRCLSNILVRLKIRNLEKKRSLEAKKGRERKTFMVKFFIVASFHLRDLVLGKKVAQNFDFFAIKKTLSLITDLVV